MVRTTATLVSLVGLSSFMATMVSAGGMIGQVVDSQNFCVFLPPKGEMDKPLSDNEWDSEAYCMGNTPGAKGANSLPDGFIQSAHYVATDDYVQVTGQFDPTKIGLNPLDDGGQCDVAAPKGSSCVGWKYYVNLIEPSGNTYCMRCCNDTKTCNRGISEKGCAHIIPGDYSGPMNGSGGGMPTSSSSTTAKSTPSHTSSSKSSTTTTTKPAPSPTSTPDSDSSSSSGSTTTTSPGSDGSADPSDPDSGSPETSSSSSSSPENPLTSSSSSNVPQPPVTSSSVVVSSSALPSSSSSSASSSSSVPPSSDANASASANLGQSSVSAQSVSQASSKTTTSILAGGLIALVGVVLVA